MKTLDKMQKELNEMEKVLAVMAIGKHNDKFTRKRVEDYLTPNDDWDCMCNEYNNPPEVVWEGKLCVTLYHIPTKTFQSIVIAPERN